MICYKKGDAIPVVVVVGEVDEVVSSAARVVGIAARGLSMTIIGAGGAAGVGAAVVGAAVVGTAVVGAAVVGAGVFGASIMGGIIIDGDGGA